MYWVNCDSYGRNKIWFLVVYEVNGLMWSIFLNNNSDLIIEFLQIINLIKSINTIHLISFINT